ncbi:MAG: hypothetical protein SGILL_002163 [Bacillariaceae sp.]
MSSSQEKNNNGGSTNASSSSSRAESSNEDPGPKAGDLVIREGFPALMIPSSNGSYQPMLTGEEPLPRHAFVANENCIQFHQEYLQTLQEDCETVFSARDKPDGAAYSAGQTFFLPANKEPRCALEALAMMIFHKHTEHLPTGTFNPATSGANWWTLVMDSDDENAGSESGEKEHQEAPVAAAATASTNDTKNSDDAANDDEEDDDDEDEVGLHFDADYELEDQTNIMLHPRVATVTYLSDCGAPTVIFNLKSPPMDDQQRKALESNIDKAWLSHPQLGKHVAFDGRLLHGAPALYFPSRQHDNGGKRDKLIINDEDGKPAAKRQKLDDGSHVDASKRPIISNGKRYTLLVNVWLNHWVMDAALLDEEVCVKLKTPWNGVGGTINEETRGNLEKGDEVEVGTDNDPLPFTWNKDVDLSKDTSSNFPTIALKASNVDPAGEDEIALCNHHVTMFYNPLMSECHKASQLAPTVEMKLQENAIRLRVDGVVEEEEEDE